VLTFIGGPGHVSTTAWLYADRVPRAYFQEHPIRFYWAPLGVIVGVTALFSFWPDHIAAKYVNTYFSFWLLWHYQKQNWGIISFCSRVSSGESASKIELVALRVAVIAGWLAAVRSAGFGGLPIIRNNEDLFYQAGATLYCAVPVLVIAALVMHPGLRRSPPRLFFLLASCSFFLPALIFSDNASAFQTYALAHGLQYQVFMSYLATAPGTGTRSSDSRIRRVGVPALLLCIIGFGIPLSIGGDVGLVSKLQLAPLYGFVLGFTMAHFIVDAGIWRLRDEFVRGYVREAFPFMAAPRG
jgi:hypothetical protein